MKTKAKIFIFIFLIIFLLANNILILRVFALGTDSSKNISRVVLVELFIQATCPDCPHVEFCLEDLVWEYGLEKLILLEEHLWGDGYDIPETKLEISASKNVYDSTIIIEVKIKNINRIHLENIAICGMI